ncbi:MAG TPA: tRNA preQ1(34) S-adenosylmethionine ribosyltransferase-isomerase QueA, partial [Phycisphaerales bacterium]|nr:tRNA preQ1(34) S-adenosylmethionine ribosyltransferase-isomerase QueA [Phycisphaerales bacterium]
MPMTGQVDEFDYPLDPQLIAQQPLTGRDESRLFVLRRRDEWYQHLRFRDLPTALHKGDLLVLNDTRVVPAKFFCRRETGGRVEGLFLSERADGAWEVLLKNAGKCHPGEQLAFQPEDATRLSLRENLGEGRWFVAAEPPTPAETVLHRVGVTPLPPYIHRADAARDAADRARYQTVYAARPGAVAAPTAGLHFTPELLASLEDAGIATTRLTLHVGMGTFAPVKSETVAQHRMHAEWYELPPAAAEAVNAARRDGRRVVAVGTTSVRVLE